MRPETHSLLLKVLKSNEEGMTTVEVAKAVGLSRSVTSHYLNELLYNGEAIQKGSKPVYWQSVEHNTTKTDDVFQQFIGSEGSAKDEINKCKAAVLYPPLGLPLLIHGASGVGKSFLAQLIYDYLHEQKANGAEKLFVFNCADYANNPELLSSILFGHTKGAFTGAEKEKKGLLAQADNGLLFLDEVHRLSNENQEKLFQFMDTGQFRPIGEEEKTVTSKVRLLFATTEDPAKVLLATFYRRISVIIELPSFHERPIFERIELIKYLFLREAKRIKRNICISNEILARLANEELPGNVGSLANEVQMYCADALRKNMTAETITIGEEEHEEGLILNYTDEGLTTENELVKSLDEMFLDILNRKQSFLELKQSLIQFHRDFLEESLTLSNHGIDGQIKASVQKRNRLVIDNEKLTEEPLKCLLRIFQVNRNTLAKERLDQLEQRFSKSYPRALLLASNLTKDLHEEIRPFVRVFLGILLAETVSEEIRYQALLVAHGNTTASSIQAVANKLCDDYVFDAINMPLTASIKEVIAQVKLWLSERDTSEGVIMLVDMGSLTQLYKSLKPQILGELLVINNLTTSYALEIGQQLVNGNMFLEIAKIAEANFKTDVQYFEGFAVEKNVIISSISGQDIAKKIKGICQTYFNPDIKLIVLNYNELGQTLDRAYTEEGYLRETALIITTSYLENKSDVPSINLLDVLDEDTESRLNKDFKNLIHPNNIPMIINEFLHFFSKEGLSEKLEFLNPDVIIRQVEDVINKCEKRFNLQINAKMKFNLMMHSALMIERTILGAEDYPVPEDIHTLMLNNKTFYQNVKSIFYTLEQFYKIEISNWELYILYEILLG